MSVGFGPKHIVKFSGKLLRYTSLSSSGKIYTLWLCCRRPHFCYCLLKSRPVVNEKIATAVRFIHCGAMLNRCRMIVEKFERMLYGWGAPPQNRCVEHEKTVDDVLAARTSTGQPKSCHAWCQPMVSLWGDGISLGTWCQVKVHCTLCSLVLRFILYFRLNCYGTMKLCVDTCRDMERHSIKNLEKLPNETRLNVTQIPR